MINGDRIMLCPFCSSTELIYDFDHGYIVCTTCGSIVDTIFIEFYEDYSNEVKHEEMGLLNVRKGLEKKKKKMRERRITKMYMDVKIYEKYAKRARKNVYVDFEAAIKHEQGKQYSGRIYRHKADEKIIEILDSDPLIKHILENIINKDPILSSRTPRGKIALALILKHIIEGHNIDLEDICRKTSLSSIHAKRLINLLKKRINIPLMLTSPINISKREMTNVQEGLVYGGV